MIYRGRVMKGAILLETGVAFPEGAEVRIEVIPAAAPPAKDTKDEPLAHMTDLAVETGIPDLAANLDHYLYGHPRSGKDE